MRINDVPIAAVTITEEVDSLRVDWLEPHIPVTLIARELLEQLIENENERRYLDRENAELRAKLYRSKRQVAGLVAWLHTHGARVSWCAP